MSVPDVPSSPAVGVLSPTGTLEGGVVDQAVVTGWRAVTVSACAAAGVALALGLVRLGGPSFWVDEAFTARALDRGFGALLERQIHLPFYLVLEPWARVAGTSEWALRLPAVLAAMAACALLVVLGSRLLDRRVAVAAGVLLAVSPFVVKWSQQARSYTLVLAVALGATLLLLRALERGTREAWATYGVVFSLLIVLHPVSGLLLMPPHLVLAYQRRDRVLPHGLLAAVVVAVIGVPWGATVAMRSIGEGVAMNWLKFPTAEVAAWALLDVSGAVGLGLGFSLLGLVVLRRAGESELAVWLGTWAFAPFALALLVSTIRPIYLDRYLIVAAPAFALLSGVALVSLTPRARAVAVGVLAVAVGAGLLQWYSSADEGNWRGEDWRKAVATVHERRSEADAIVVVPWSSAPAASYYGVDVRDTSTVRAIWVLTWSETGDEMTAAERRGLGFGEHRLVERLQFGWRVSAQLWRRDG